jgi:GntR family transcriptional regulator
MDVQTSVQLSAAAPKYIQLREAMIAMIKTERLAAGHLLPSEAELCERFSVSRGTIRRAFDDLERAGLVTRESGRGTFVAAQRMERPLPELTSFSEHIESLGMTPGAELVSYREGTDYAEPGTFFAPGERLARIVRVRTADGRPVGLHTLLMPVVVLREAGISGHGLRMDPTVSVYRRLAAIGIEIDLARESIAARRATSQESRRLQLGTREPVLEVVRQSYAIDGRPVEHVRAVYRADRYDYITWLRRPGATVEESSSRRK